MVFPQILSHMPLLFDQWLPRCKNYPCVIRYDNMLGGSRLENDGNPQKTNFQQVLKHFPGFENYTFFDFQKKIFHSTLTNKSSKQSFSDVRKVKPG